MSEKKVAAASCQDPANPALSGWSGSSTPYLFPFETGRCGICELGSPASLRD